MVRRVLKMGTATRESDWCCTGEGGCHDVGITLQFRDLSRSTTNQVLTGHKRIRCHALGLWPSSSPSSHGDV